MQFHRMLPRTRVFGVAGAVGKEAAEAAAREVIEKAVKEAAQEAIEAITREVGEEAIEAVGREAAEEIAERAAREAIEKAAREAGEELSESAAREIGEAAAREALEEAVESTSKSVAKKATKNATAKIISKYGTRATILVGGIWVLGQATEGMGAAFGAGLGEGVSNWMEENPELAAVTGLGIVALVIGLPLLWIFGKPKKKRSSGSSEPQKIVIETTSSPAEA